MSTTHSAAVISICKEKLLSTKAFVLEQISTTRSDLASREFSGDEADLSVQVHRETQLFATNQRLRRQLLEIEMALSRIDAGTFGLCEETGEEIESERLLALPWTRLSVEGAEIRERIARRQGQVNNL